MRMEELIISLGFGHTYLVISRLGHSLRRGAPRSEEFGARAQLQKKRRVSPTLITYSLLLPYLYSPPVLDRMSDRATGIAAAPQNTLRYIPLFRGLPPQRLRPSVRASHARSAAASSVISSLSHSGARTPAALRITPAPSGRRAARGRPMEGPSHSVR